MAELLIVAYCCDGISELIANGRHNKSIAKAGTKK